MAAEIRAEMARQGRSRRWLAAEIGESHVTVGRWITGKTPMSLDVLDAMCRALGMGVADLLRAVERNGGYEPVAVLPRRRGGTDTRQESGRDTEQYEPALAA